MISLFAKKQNSNVRWWISGTIIITTTINHMDRLSPCIAVPHIKKNMAISKLNQHIDNFEKLLTTVYLKYKEVWGVALSRFVSGRAFYFFLLWLSRYLVDVKVFFISLALYTKQFKRASLFTTPVDLFDIKNVASTWSISGSACSIGAILFTIVSGWLVDSISYSSVFVIVAFLHILSVLIIHLFIPEIKRVSQAVVI